MSITSSSTSPTSSTMAADHPSFESLFPDAPAARLELRPDPRRGAFLHLPTGAAHPAHLDLQLTRSLLTLFLILLSARENDDPSSRNAGWRSRQDVLDAYGAIHSTIATDGVPRNVRLINHRFREALRSERIDGDGAQLISTDGAYKLGVREVTRVGALAGVDLTDVQSIKAALALG